ncbi:KH domain-containing protein [Tunturibacter empetritectus]|uniref:RNA-binding protein KhpA n=1 Tax=Tunturiibacter lichenicola TaxID=2051959 RepID=A0A7W8J6E1_9BACT|nr:KH domain-containing protein [Edaphobacter lichenicola]MBB5343393.1 putative RNA-binding protein YlqC (UPF0109 family) [Edaphobacter lichenicola]
MSASTWQNPAHFQSCDGKRAFRSLAEAEIEAERASKKTGELILAYTCYDCGRFNVGHADLSQQLARILHLDRPCQRCGQVEEAEGQELPFNDSVLFRPMPEGRRSGTSRRAGDRRSWSTSEVHLTPMADQVSTPERENIVAMTALVSRIVHCLVEEASAVSIQAVTKNHETSLRIKVAQEDVGKLIGKHGRTARSLRTILMGASMKLRQRFALEILEEHPRTGRS